MAKAAMKITIEYRQRWYFWLMWDFALFVYWIGLVDAKSAASWLAKYGFKFQVVKTKLGKAEGRGVSISTGSQT